MFIPVDDQIFIVAFFKQTNIFFWVVICQHGVSQHPPLIIQASFHSRDLLELESKMAADPNPQRNTLAESTNQQQQFQALIHDMFAPKLSEPEKGMPANHRSKTKSLFVLVSEYG